MSDIAGTIS